MSAVAVRVACRYAAARGIWAGIFEAPPAMMESVGGWISSVYAGHVLAAVEVRLSALRDQAGAMDQQIAEMQASLASCERGIKRLKPGQAVRYKIWPEQRSRSRRTVLGLDHEFIGVRRKENLYRQPGNNALVFVRDGEEPDPNYLPLYEIGRGKRKLDFLQGPSHLLLGEAVEKVKAALLGSIDRLRESQSIAGLVQKGKPLDRPQLVETLLLRKECLKYVDTPKAYTARAAKGFPLDLTGWKYLRSGSPIIKSVNEKIQKRNDQIDEQLEVARKTLDLAREAFIYAQKSPNWREDLKVRAHLSQLGKRDWYSDQDISPRYPVWDANRTRASIEKGERPNELLVWVRSEHGFRVAPYRELEKDIEPLLGSDDVVRALEHRGWETIHVTLDFVGHKATLGTWRTIDKALNVDVRGEIPTTVDRFRSLLEDLLRTTRHELQHLGQDALAYIEQLGGGAGVPSPDLRAPGAEAETGRRKEHALREVEFYTRLADEIDEFVLAVRRSPPSDMRGFFQRWVTSSREFFKMLMQHEPLRWHKALKEFAKGLNARGVEVPGKPLG